MAREGGAAPPRPVTDPAPWLLEYHSPARSWEREGLPIGNGTLGAMVLGGPGDAELVFNVGSLWTGDANPSGQFDDDGFGNYQAFGTLSLELYDLAAAGDYTRRLDLSRAVHTATFIGPDGTRYAMEALASAPARVIALRLRADGPAELRGRLRLVGAHGERTRSLPRGLELAGKLTNGLVYAARLGAVSDGQLHEVGDDLTFTGGRTLTLYLAADTDYALDAATHFRGAPPGPRIGDAVARAEGAGFDATLREHVVDHARLFSRVDADFGRSSGEVRSLTTDLRVERYTPNGDPELLATLFHYGRYLLIASSRPGGLPANLQGIWNESNHPPWHCDYHSNINLQMNYWLAEPTNLAECHLPLFDLLDATLPAARDATRSAFGPDTKGFTYRTSQNVFGGQGWEWNTPAGAWYAMHYWEHYAFSLDCEFLERRAYPYLREATEFWLGRLVRRDDGKLVAPDGWSPEHGPREDGVTYDQELVWELMADTLSAARALGIDDAFVRRVRAAQRELLGPRVGRFGQLMEWTTDRDDPEDRHRHVSQLVGVFPGHHISALGTKELAKAAEVSLRARGDTGDSQRSWTWPWRCALWARLRTPECHRMLDGYVAHNLLPNLLATHPPLQLDGSYGISAGIAEMLLQSHAGALELLPGVDLSRWPSGSFRGLRARGGFEVAARWYAGALADAQILSLRGGPLEVKSSPTPTGVSTEPGDAVAAKHTKTGALRFETKAGERYRLIW